MPSLLGAIRKCASDVGETIKNKPCEYVRLLLVSVHNFPALNPRVR